MTMTARKVSKPIQQHTGLPLEIAKMDGVWYLCTTDDCTQAQWDEIDDMLEQSEGEWCIHVTTLDYSADQWIDMIDGMLGR